MRYAAFVGSHPLNLTVRFLLELCAWTAVGRFGWTRFHGAWRVAMVVVLPLALMVFWGVFAVPHDPSRGGTPVVPIPGVLRLLLELAVFGVGAWALYATGQGGPALVLSAAVALHYALSWDRIRWLLQR